MKIHLTALSTAFLWIRTASACSGTIARLTNIECSYQNFLDSLDASCTASDVLGADAAQAEATIAALCKYDAPTQFVEIQGTYQADRRYFKGGGDLVDGGLDWHSREANVQRFDDNLASSTLISYPEYLARVTYNKDNGLGDNGYPANMNLETSCGLQTMMCCFTNPLYGAPDDEGTSFDASTDVCRHDLADSPQSNHIKGGWSVFPKSEGGTFCTGFSWSSEDEPLGNMLYDISLHNTVSRGYLEGVPGAPMCGCVEHMPKVETATCRTASVDSYEFTFNYDDETQELTASNTAGVSYSDCDGDLAAEYAKKHADAPDAIGEYLVGEGGCAGDLDTYFNEEQFIYEGEPRSARYSTPDDNWSGIIVGEGSRFMPAELDLSQTDSWFRDLINANCTTDGEERMCIVRRICDSCSVESHRDIYYRRLTALPPMGPDADAGEVYFVDTFMNNWFDNTKGPQDNGDTIRGVKFNEMGVDFTLHSSYEDAKAGKNMWLFCNYNDPNIGFPRDCGPNGYTHSQWNSYKRGGAHAEHHGYYVEVPSNEGRRKARYLSEMDGVRTASHIPAVVKS